MPVQFHLFFKEETFNTENYKDESKAESIFHLLHPHLCKSLSLKGAVQ